MRASLAAVLDGGQCKVNGVPMAIGSEPERVAMLYVELVLQKMHHDNFHPARSRDRIITRQLAAQTGRTKRELIANVPDDLEDYNLVVATMERVRKQARSARFTLEEVECGPGLVD